jgi:hypothetical protein
MVALCCPRFPFMLSCVGNVIHHTLQQKRERIEDEIEISDKASRAQLLDLKFRAFGVLLKDHIYWGERLDSVSPMLTIQLLNEIRNCSLIVGGSLIRPT